MTTSCQVVQCEGLDVKAREVCEDVRMKVSLIDGDVGAVLPEEPQYVQVDRNGKFRSPDAVKSGKCLSVPVYQTGPRIPEHAYPTASIDTDFKAMVACGAPGSDCYSAVQKLNRATEERD